MLTMVDFSRPSHITVLYYLHADDSQVLHFPNGMTTKTMEEMWREHFAPVAEELLYKITSSDLIPL